MKKWELKEILKLDQIINCKIRQLDELKKREYGVKTVIKDVSGVGGTRVSLPTENAALKIITLSKDIDNDIDRLAGMKDRAKKEFRELDLTERYIMELRYIECLDWEKASKTAGYCRQHMYKIHGKALKKLKKVVS